VGLEGFEECLESDGSASWEGALLRLAVGYFR
jgi:hypothetical protein